MIIERSFRTTGGVSRRPDLGAAGPTGATSWRDRAHAEAPTRQNPRWFHLRRPPWAADPSRVQGLACPKSAAWCQRGWHV